MRTYVITRSVPNNINDLITIAPNDFVIAVDGALPHVLKQKINVDLVIGDLDSLKDKAALKGLEYIKLNREKDETDTFVAVKYAYEKTNNEVFLIGGIKGDRIEHFIANTMLLDKYPKLTIIDNNTQIYLLEEGKHLVSKESYISFFGFNEATLSLEGFKYSLSRYKLKSFDPLCISNEIIKTYGEVNVHAGRVLIIKTKKQT